MLCFLICHFLSGLLTNGAAATQISSDRPSPCLAIPCHSTIETFQSAARRASRKSALVTTHDRSGLFPSQTSESIPNPGA